MCVCVREGRMQRRINNKNIRLLPVPYIIDVVGVLTRSAKCGLPI